MATGQLSSDHVNYLIWRYLQESGYGESAVKLQRDWNLEPQKLPFSRHIHSGALVTLVQKGLRYHEVENEYDRDGNYLTTLPDSYYYFGRENAQEPEVRPDRLATTATATNSPVLKPVEEVPATSASKSPPSASAAATVEARPNGISNGDVMEVDEPEHEFDHKLLTPPASTSGSSIAVQVDKVEELGDTTQFIEFPTKRIMTFNWNPQKSGSLAIGGTQSLCRIWNQDSNQQTIPEPSVIEINSHTDTDSCLTVVTWSPNGEWIATGSDSGRVAIWSGKGVLYQDLTSAASTIIQLKWSKSGRHLLGVSGDGTSSSMVVWDAEKGDILKHYIVSVDPHDRSEFSGQIYDVIWIDESKFIASGERILHVYNIENDDKTPVQAFQADDILTFVRFDATCERIITASTSNEICVWGKTSNTPLQRFRGHAGPVTALEWQPGEEHETIKHFVSASVDGTIRVYGGSDHFELVHNLQFSRSDAPVMAVAFSPDGQYLCGVSDGSLLVWSSGEAGMPRASWRYPNKSWREPSPDDGLKADQSLAWSSDGTRLAYMINNQIAIITLRSGGLVKDS